MLLDGDPRWEFRYLHNLLERDKQVQAATVLFRQPFLNLLTQPYIAGTLTGQRNALRQQLSRTDLLIIGDVSPAQVDAGVWELIEEAVSRDGMTVLFIPGRRDLPISFQSDHVVLFAASHRLSVSGQRSSFVLQQRDSEQTMFRLTLSPEGLSLPMFQLSEDPSVKATTLSVSARTSVDLWSGSEAWCNRVGKQRRLPVWISHRNRRSFIRIMDLVRPSGWVSTAPGAGVCAPGDQWHYKFWGQLIRWAARNKSAAGNDDVRMTLSDVVVDESESVEAVVRWNPRASAATEQCDGCRNCRHASFFPAAKLPTANRAHEGVDCLALS